MKKILSLLENMNDRTFLFKAIANPEIQDEYYGIPNRNKHHLCFIKEYIDDNVLFESLINSYEATGIPEEILKYRMNNNLCLDCELNCFNSVHYMFNFATYTIFVNVELNPYLKNKNERKKIVLKCLNLFSVKNERLTYDFQRMSIYFSEYDIEKQYEELSSNKNIIQNMEYINDQKDFIYYIQNKINNATGVKVKTYKSKIKFLKQKEKFYDKKLFLQDKSERFKEENLSAPFNFDKISDDLSKEKSKSNVFKYEAKKRETLSELALKQLNEYGFSKLETLKNRNASAIVTHIFNKQTYSYKVAYLHFLGFTKHLEVKFCKTRVELNKILATIFNTSDREIAGNMNVLTCKNSKEKRPRYNADEQLEKVIKHYQLLD